MKNKKVLAYFLFLFFILTQNLPAATVDLLGQWNVVPAADWLDYSGSLLFFESQIPTQSNLVFDIAGHFDWFRNGNYVGTELFSGSLNDKILNFTGYALINPNFINMATYYGEVSSDGNRIINGTWYPPTGYWEAERNPVPIPGAALLFGSGMIVFASLRMKRNYKVRCQ